MEDQENVEIEAFKQLLGDAMLLGMQLADNSYAGGIGDERNVALARSMERLQVSVAAYLCLRPEARVGVEQVMPFSETIRDIVRVRSNQDASA